MSKLIQTRELVELLTPRSDQNVTSPHNIHTLPSQQMVRIPKANQAELFILI